MSIPFAGSLSPNSRSVDNADQTGIAVDLGGLSPGTYLEKAGEYSRYFVIRDFDGEVYVYVVRHYGDAYRVPDITWDRPSIPCVQFGPEASGNRLVRDGKIRCHDPDLSDWWRRELVWDYAGRSMGERTDDIPEADYEVLDDMLIIKGSYWPLSDIAPGEV